MNIITQNHIIEFCTLIVSVIFFKSLHQGKLKTFPFFLAFIFFVEFTGAYIRKGLHSNNVWVYNLTIPIEYAYYLFLFWLHGGKLLKNFTRICASILFFVCVFYLLLLPIKLLHTNVLVCGQLMVIISSCIYIYEIFTKAEEESLFKNYFYWIVSGLFLFNLGDVIYFVFFPTIHAKGWDKLDHIFESINRNLLLLLYLSYIVSILVFKKYYQIKNAGDN